MLRVEVSVPATGQTYEFAINEHAKVPEVIDEIASVVSVREQRPWKGRGEGLILCDASEGMVLPMERTLHQCKVSPGSKLVLV